MTTINLTQHPATADQKNAGVEDLPAETLPRLKELLTFEEPPTLEEMDKRCEGILFDILMNHKVWDDPTGPHEAMIGGAAYFLPVLAETLRQHGFKPVHAFTKRVVEESLDAEGKRVKTSVFKHVGFVDHPFDLDD